MGIQQRGGRWQLRFPHKILPKPFFQTFDSEEEAIGYRERLKVLLDAGRIPDSIQAPADRTSDPLLPVVIRNYCQSTSITPSDDALLGVLRGSLKAVKMSQITARWSDEFVQSLKLIENNAPGTIRKKVGVLARVVHWHIRMVTPKDQPLPANPLRSLPRGYSVYNGEDIRLLGEGKEAKRDVVRDRRLGDDERDRIRAALSGGEVKGMYRELIARPDHLMLFDLIVDTGLRLLEAYSLRSDQLELERGFIRVDGSKGHHGYIKPRTVPLKKELREKLAVYAEGKTGRLFPFWDGTIDGKKIATRDLVQVFGRIFTLAKVPEFTEHDLRHEACCRWVTMPGKQGGWMFSETEVAKIMGWSNLSMMLRYASLRGDDLANRLL